MDCCVIGNEMERKEFGFGLEDHEEYFIFVIIENIVVLQVVFPFAWNRKYIPSISLLFVLVSFFY